MKFCISFGKIELKYFFYCFLSVILYIYIYYFIVDSKENNIINEHELLYSFCYYLGYLLNFIPVWIIQIKSKKEEGPKNNKMKERETQSSHSIEYIYSNPYDKNLSKKNILKFLFMCFILLLIDLIESTLNIIDKRKKDKDNNNENKNESQVYNDDFNIIEFLIIFLVSKCDKEVYYKHQNISFLILIVVESIKNIYIFIKKEVRKDYDISTIMETILVLIKSILYAIFYLYIKGLMKYNYISPAKCNFMIGFITVPIIIIIYIIISLTPLREIIDNIFALFIEENINAKNITFLITLPFAYLILLFVLNKIIYEYTIYHFYIPILIEYFVQNIFKNLESIERIILISSFFFELIMILIFVEIIEINYCGLNENLKRNIELRGLSDSISLNNELNNDDDFDE